MAILRNMDIYLYVVLGLIVGGVLGAMAWAAWCFVRKGVQSEKDVLRLLAGCLALVGISLVGLILLIAREGLIEDNPDIDPQGQTQEAS